MAECSHNCSSCQENCASRTKESLLKPQNVNSNIKNVIAIMSGKGGVGKSMVTSLLATSLNKMGYKVGIMDADITGPSIPKVFGLNEMAKGTDTELFPVSTKLKTKVMSANLLIEDKSDPIIWRGPVIAGVVQQFWTDVHWGDLDYLFVDMPPGTGDVPLTVFQSLPVNGIVVVTSPQDLVSLIVEKAVKMANKMDIKVCGIVENMSYFVCDNCMMKHYIYGESKVEEIASSYHIDYVSKMPIDPSIASLSDEGLIEEYDTSFLKNVITGITSISK